MSGHLKINRLRKIHYIISTCGHHWLATFHVSNKTWEINGEPATPEDVREEFRICVVKNKTIELVDGTRYSAKQIAAIFSHCDVRIS